MNPDNMKGVDGTFRVLAVKRQRTGAVVSGSQAKNPVLAMQKDLLKIGSDGVRPTGKLDEATVRAINGVFNGWDDAPKNLTTGNLTISQVSKNQALVARYLHKAIGEMKSFSNVNEPDLETD